MKPYVEGNPHSSTQPGIEQNTEAFTSLITENGAPRNILSVNKFVKKLDRVLDISLPLALPRRASISLTKWELAGQFTGPWPSSKLVQKWVERN